MHLVRLEAIIAEAMERLAVEIVGPYLVRLEAELTEAELIDDLGNQD